MRPKGQDRCFFKQRSCGLEDDWRFTGPFRPAAQPAIDPICMAYRNQLNFNNFSLT